MNVDERLFAPSTERNRSAITAVLRDVLPAEEATCLPSSPVLEIGSGSGEHAIYFAQQFPHLTWQPSEISLRAQQSIRAWARYANLPNLLPPLALDVNIAPWPITAACAIVAINVIHYSPASTTTALFDGAARILPDNGVLYLYGPYRRHGHHTAASNEQFDAWLKTRDPSFAVPDLETIALQAQARGLLLEHVVEMPANNLSVVLRRA